jgi:hypothetical protein
MLIKFFNKLYKTLNTKNIVIKIIINNLYLIIQFFNALQIINY